MQQLRDAGNIVANQGFKTIGKLIMDSSIFPGPPDTWEVGDLAYYYGAKPSSFIVDESVIEFLILPGSTPGDTATVAGVTSCVEFKLEAVTVAAGLPSTIKVEVELGRPYYTIRGQIPIGHPGHRDRRALIDPNGYFACSLAQSFGLTSTGGLLVP